MIPIYFRELEPYRKSYIKKLLGEEIYIKLRESDHIGIDKDSCKFNFVGVILLNNYVLRCYPKYMPYVEPEGSNELEKDFEDVMKVIKKYKKQNEPFQYENEVLKKIPFNLLSLMLFFIEDYYENGVYSNIRNILEINGNGEINWDKTINDNFALIKNNKPYYVELYTQYKIDDLYNYFRLLHEYIITKCSKRLKNAGILDIFGLVHLDLSDKSKSDFGDDKFILAMLEKELNMEFNTHKRKLLKSMHAYIANENSFDNENFLTLYGANSYEQIWEKICSEVFDNKLGSKIDDLNLTIDSKFKYDSTKTLKNSIEKPNWVFNEGLSNNKMESLKPDIITFDEKSFIILDAKYYDFTYNKDKINGPGISDITKQYFYQLAYNDFKKAAGFEKVRNAFLMPTFDSQVKNLGFVELNMLHKLCKGKNKTYLENIQIILLPARDMNNYYLNGVKMPISKLELDKYYCPECDGFNKIDNEYCEHCGEKLNRND